MKLASIPLFLCLSVWAQTPAPAGAPAPGQLPNLPDGQVIAIFDDGVKFTMGDFKRIYAALPLETQKMAAMDRQKFLQQWAFFRKLTKMAEADRLDQESPTKELIEYNRMTVLMNAELSRALLNITVEPEEIVKYYDEHKEDYKGVHLRAIYIAFGSKLTEEQAKAKASKLLTQIRGGADFVKLVKENSDDETSRAKDGDFLTLHRSDNVPEVMRNAVFQLKKGEVSEPVRQPNGFYLFRAEDVSYRPLSQVRDEIFSTVKGRHYAEWLAKSNEDTKVTFTSPEFIGAIPGLPPGTTIR
jgi:peptidyl-prolyl cis-trans isomerase C